MTTTVNWTAMVCSKKPEEKSTLLIVFLWIFFVLGCIKYLKLVWWLLKQIFCKCNCCCKANLSKYKKEEESWAVITGGSDGIGYEVCKQMAGQGFNTCMMARNQTKMDGKVKELEGLYPNVKHDSVKVDFSELTTLQEYRDLIEKLAGKDVAFVALNAGLARSGSVNKIEDKSLEEVMKVNGL